MSPRTDEDFRNEIESHVAIEADRLVQEGMDPADARDAALRRFGNPTTVRERFYESRRVMWFDHLRQDFRYALRTFARGPLFALTATASLAIGIGASTTVFTVANGLLLRAPQGVSAPHRLVEIVRTEDGSSMGVNDSSYPNYLDVRARATTLDGVYGYQIQVKPISLGGPAGAELVFSNLVTSNFFTVLGVAAAAGRLFGEADREQPGQAPVVVLSHQFWRRRFDADPKVIGQTITLNRHPFVVIGVAADGFRGTGILAPDVWVPVSMTDVVEPGSGAHRLTSRVGGWLQMGARLKAGVSLEQAAAEVDAIGRALEYEFPAEFENRGAGLSLAAISSIPPGLRVPAAGFLALLMAIVVLVLVIASANVAGVLLVRASARRREIAVRLAIGAGRRRLVAQLLTETMVLFVAGGCAGLLLARGLTTLLLSLLPAFTVPVELSLPLDGRAIAFATTLSLIAAVLSGLVPALDASKADIMTTLKNGAPGLAGGSRSRNGFVIAQVALSILLVVTGALLMRALASATAIDHGFDSHGVETVSIDLSLAGYIDTTGPRFARELLNRVRQMPRVQHATLADRSPLRGSMALGVLTVPGVAPPPGQRFLTADWNIVESGYFTTLRIPLVRGRDFTDADRSDTPGVVIVDEATAGRLWPGSDPIGQVLSWQPGMPRGDGGAASPTQKLSVIGIVRDLNDGSRRRDRRALVVYVPLQQRYLPQMTVFARTTDGQRLTSDLRAVVASMDSNVPILAAQTLDEQQAGPVQTQIRVAASVSGSFGVVAVLLAAMGLYGIAAYAVTQRLREIGIRIALGATRANVLRMVLRQGTRLAFIGSVIGLALAAAASRLLLRLLGDVSPLDPVAYGGAAMLFALVSVSACCIPARRATRIDPVTTLRDE